MKCNTNNRLTMENIIFLEASVLSRPLASVQPGLNCSSSRSENNLVAMSQGLLKRKVLEETGILNRSTGRLPTGQ